MKKGKLVRIGEKRLRVPMTVEQETLVKKYSYLLGLSEDKCLEALLLNEISSKSQNAILMNQSINLTTNDENTDWSAREPIKMENFLEGAERKVVKQFYSNNISLNLALSQYPKSEDPIVTTLEAVSNHFKLSKPDLIKELYYCFINENFEVTEIDSETHQSVMTNEINAEDVIDFILGIKTFLPFGWSANPWNDLEKMETGELVYAFLSKGNYKHTQSVTLYYKNSRDDLLFKTIHLVCKALFRDRSSFFQMLYMYYLKNNDLLDSGLELEPDWESRLKKIKKLSLK